MTDPKNTEFQEMISKKTGLKVVPYFATDNRITMNAPSAELGTTISVTR